MKNIFKVGEDTLNIKDSEFNDFRRRGALLKNVNPLELFLDRIKSKDVLDDYKESLIEIFNESMDKKVITSLGKIISDFYKNVGDYMYSKIDMTDIYDEFVSKFANSVK